MKKATLIIHTDTVLGGEAVDRWVCKRGHPHPTLDGATTCETNIDAGVLTDAELLALFDAEVAAFNA